MDNSARRFWWLGILLGIGVGVLVALLLAPDSGRRFRERLLGRVGRLRLEVRGTERFGGGEHADPIAALKRRTLEAREAAQQAYLERRVQLEAELAEARRPKDDEANF